MTSLFHNQSDMHLTSSIQKNLLILQFWGFCIVHKCLIGSLGKCAWFDRSNRLNSTTFHWLLFFYDFYMNRKQAKLLFFFSAFSFDENVFISFYSLCHFVNFLFKSLQAISKINFLENVRVNWDVKMCRYMCSCEFALTRRRVQTPNRKASRY